MERPPRQPQPYPTDAINASENDDFPTDFAIFTKALPTDGLTDVLSYREAMAGPKSYFDSFVKSSFPTLMVRVGLLLHLSQSIRSF